MNAEPVSRRSKLKRLNPVLDSDDVAGPAEVLDPAMMITPGSACAIVRTQRATTAMSLPSFSKNSSSLIPSSFSLDHHG